MRTSPHPSVETNAEWIRWGREDPLYGVASWAGRRRTDAQPWTDAEFYALGRSDWADFQAHWVRYGFDPAVVVEVGCGAGRITAALADTAGHVHAVDVSRDMLAYAQARVTAPTVTWHLGDGRSLPLPDGTATAAFSCHVLQHLPTVEVGLAYLTEVVRVLRPGGTLLIHLPLVCWPLGRPGQFARALAAAMAPVARMVARVRRWRMARGGPLCMQGISYELSRVVAHLQALGCTHVEIAILPMTSNGGLHPCVLATRG